MGRALGEGKPLQEILAGMHAVAEGVWSSQAVLALAKKHRVDMPITETTYRILYEKMAPMMEMRLLSDRLA